MRIKSNRGLPPAPFVIAPSEFGFDMDLIKRIRMTESKELEFRLDAVDVLNHTNFSGPTTNIDSTAFGSITTASYNRRFTFNARVNF